MKHSLSTDIIDYLMNRRHFTLVEIARLTGCAAPRLCNIRKGQGGFTVSQLAFLEMNLKTPLPIILLEATSKSISEPLRKKYTELMETLNRSVEIIRKKS